LPSQTKWYSYYDGSVAPKGYATLNAPLNFINLHIRGGYIIPTQKPDKNTSFSRKNPFGLIVALDVNKLANGELFWDDGDSIDSIEKSDYFLAKFLFTGNKLSMFVNENNYDEIGTLTLDTVRLLGFADTALNRDNSKPEFTIEVRQGARLQYIEVTDFTVNEHGEVKLSNLNLKLNENFEIYFKQIILPEVIDVNDERLRSDCFPEDGATQTSCQNRGCTWKAATITGQDIPWCFIAKTRASYTLQGAPTTNTGVERSTSVYKANKAVANSFYGDDFATIKISVELKGSKQARIKIEDDANTRYTF
jgi:maltase-glucoamylase